MRTSQRLAQVVDAADGVLLVGSSAFQLFSGDVAHRPSRDAGGFNCVGRDAGRSASRATRRTDNGPHGWPRCGSCATDCSRAGFRTTATSGRRTTTGLRSAASGRSSQRIQECPGTERAQTASGSRTGESRR